MNQPLRAPPLEPALAAIVVIPDLYPTVQATMRALQAQTAAAQMEIVFVAPTPLEVNVAELHTFHSWQIVTHPFESIGEGYAAGIHATRAPVVVLTEDHSFPAPNWAERLLAAHQNPHTVVAPAMRNGNPDTATSWADFLIAYGKWAEPITSGAMDFLPGHNSSYKRAALLAQQEHLVERLQAETVLHWELRAQGHSLYLEATTHTAHLNFAMLRPWLAAQLYSARIFAAQRARTWHAGKRALYALASPLVPVIRFLRLWGAVQRQTFDLRVRAQVCLLLACGLGVDAIGQALGYALGADATRAQNLAHEFHRVRFIKTFPSERA